MLLALFMPVYSWESLRVSPRAHMPGLKLLPYMIAIENKEHILFIFVHQYVAQCHLNKYLLNGY